jgi:hypothetical protein
MAVAGLKNLCTPSYVYFVISIVALVILAIQNAENVDVYCLGSFSCSVTNTSLIFLLKFIYILFWTWVLNLICRAGAPGIAWFLVLLPFLIIAIIIAIMMMS